MKQYLESEKNKSQYERYLELVEKEQTSIASKFKAPVMQPHKMQNSVSWGMIDESEIYNDKGDYNTIINTRVLRMLPNLTDKQIQKIEAFEKKL